MPRFIILVKSTPEAEAGVAPPAEIVKTAGESTKALAEAGNLLGAAGFQPTSKDAARIVGTASGEKTVTKGPFGEPVLGGFFIINSPSLDEAIKTLKDMPINREGSAEIRRLVEVEDIPAPPESLEKAKALRALMNKNAAALY